MVNLIPSTQKRRHKTPLSLYINVGTGSRSDPSTYTTPDLKVPKKMKPPKIASPKKKIKKVSKSRMESVACNLDSPGFFLAGPRELFLEEEDDSPPKRRTFNNNEARILPRPRLSNKPRTLSPSVLAYVTPASRTSGMSRSFSSFASTSTGNKSVATSTKKLGPYDMKAPSALLQKRVPSSLCLKNEEEAQREKSLLSLCEDSLQQAIRAFANKLPVARELFPHNNSSSMASEAASLVTPVDLLTPFGELSTPAPSIEHAFDHGLMAPPTQLAGIPLKKRPHRSPCSESKEEERTVVTKLPLFPADW